MFGSERDNDGEKNSRRNFESTGLFVKLLFGSVLAGAVVMYVIPYWFDRKKKLQVEPLLKEKTDIRGL